MLGMITCYSDVHMKSESISNSQEAEQNAESLSSLITAIEEHNRNFSRGATMGRAIGGMLSATIDEKELNTEELRQNVVADQTAGAHVGLTKLRAEHEKTLRQFGLDLVGESQTESPGVSGEVVLEIKDPDIFIRRIRTLRPLLTNEHTAEKAHIVIAGVVENLERQIAQTDFTKSRDATNAADSLPAITEAFQDVDLSIDLARLKTYARFQTSGRLEQYLEVERRGLWEAPGKGFGPADWVTDTTPEMLDGRWQDAIAVLRQQERQSNSGVAEELRDHLITCISHASEKLETLSWPDETKEEMQRILSDRTKDLHGGRAL